MNNIVLSSLRRIRPFLAQLPLTSLFPKAGRLYDNLCAQLIRSQTVFEVEGSNMHLELDHSDPKMRATFQAYAFNKNHEPSTTKLLKELIKPGDVFFDLGANIGYFSLLASKLVGENGAVHSFEPEPTNFSYLKKNFEINPKHKITLNNIAIAEQVGVEDLYVCSYDSGHHTLRQFGGIDALKDRCSYLENKKESVKVQTTTLDEYVQQTGITPDIIKIDVEGSENLAISGMHELLSHKEEISMIIEFFPLLIKEMGHNPEEMLSKLIHQYHLNANIISGEYSLNKKDDFELISVQNESEILDTCPERDDHVNLFFYKGDRYRIYK